MKLGVTVFLEDYIQKFQGQRIGLVTNMTGVDSSLIPTIDLFYEHSDIYLTALYGPEHGIRGDMKEGEKIESSIDPYTNLPVYSLYGEHRKPSKEMLDPVDVVVFDLQDIGARYYTYIYTMAYVMEACAENGKHFVVLDRPNPISGIATEGNLVEEDLRSFVGLYPIPNRHGMTVGEIAQLYKYEFGIKCELTVIPMQDWHRDMYFDETGLFWVPPSPNSTGIDMSILYPGTCLIEGTNLSEGRGTTKPFEYIGAPFIEGYRLARAFNERNIPGILARPVSFMPTYQKYKNEICEGVQLHIVDRYQLHSLSAGLTLLEIIAQLHPNEFEFKQDKEKNRYFFDLIAGTRKVRNHILKGTIQDFVDNCRKDLEDFNKRKQAYLLY